MSITRSHTPECIRCGEQHVFMGRFTIKYNDNVFGPIEALVEACLPDERVYVYWCPQCGKLEFFSLDSDHDAENREMACFECGGPIGPGESRCARCGWSWKSGGEEEL